MTDRVITAFSWLRPYVGWAMFIAGLVMFVLTAIGIASFGSDWKVLVASLAGWMVLAIEGFDLFTEETD